MISLKNTSQLFNKTLIRDMLIGFVLVERNMLKRSFVSVGSVAESSVATEGQKIAGRVEKLAGKIGTSESSRGFNSENHGLAG